MEKGILFNALNLFSKVYNSSEDTINMLNTFRSMNSNGNLTDEDYNYIITHWDKLLERIENKSCG